jgi:hypothetical protein
MRFYSLDDYTNRGFQLILELILWRGDNLFIGWCAKCLIFSRQNDYFKSGEKEVKHGDNI